MSEATETDVAEEIIVKPLQVDVYAYREGDDVLFSHAWKAEGDSKRKKGKIEVPRGQKDTPIQFHLTDRTGLNLAFLVPASDAMWVDTADCPTCPGNGGQISYTSSSQNLLKVTDANDGEPCILHFALRFSGHPTEFGPPYEYDPEIRNGGGGFR